MNAPYSDVRSDRADGASQFETWSPLNNGGCLNGIQIEQNHFYGGNCHEQTPSNANTITTPLSLFHEFRNSTTNYALEDIAWSNHTPDLVRTDSSSSSLRSGFSNRAPYDYPVPLYQDFDSNQAHTAPFYSNYANFVPKQNSPMQIIVQPSPARNRDSTQSSIYSDYTPANGLELQLGNRNYHHNLQSLQLERANLSQATSAQDFQGLQSPFLGSQSTTWPPPVESPPVSLGNFGNELCTSSAFQQGFAAAVDAISSGTFSSNLVSTASFQGDYFSHPGSGQSTPAESWQLTPNSDLLDSSTGYGQPFEVNESLKRRLSEPVLLPPALRPRYQSAIAPPPNTPCTSTFAPNFTFGRSVNNSPLSERRFGGEPFAHVVAPSNSIDLSALEQQSYSVNTEFPARSICDSPQKTLSARSSGEILRAGHLLVPPYPSDWESRSPPQSDFGNPELIPRVQSSRFPGDFYTPRWVRGRAENKEGWCQQCSKWLMLKNSGYNYHKQFTHGISAATGLHWLPPVKTRKTIGVGHEGLCHACNRWEKLQSTRGTSTNMSPWYRHAQKCHRYSAKASEDSELSHALNFIRADPALS